MVVNCEAVDGDYVLKEGDVIMHTLHKHEHPVLDLEVEVVHDSEEMLVVSKPSSWPVHPVSNYRLNSLSYVLRKEMGYEDLRAVHRIDAATSGICMMAKGSNHKQCFLNTYQREKGSEGVLNYYKAGRQPHILQRSSEPAPQGRSILPLLMGDSLRVKLSLGNLLTVIS